MRKELLKKLQHNSPQNKLGVIGNMIDLTQDHPHIASQRSHNARPTTACNKKMSRTQKNQDCHNPFAKPDTRGWEVRYKPEEFYLWYY